ncbi:MAG: 16S rRNA (guanine(527)-N(7))-methyltransferase RsmG [Pseudanabaenaceae cyanobacterium]
MSDTECPQLPVAVKFQEWWAQFPPFWAWTQTQQAQFAYLYKLVLEGNRKQNLTRISAPADFWEKHLWDSLAGISPYMQTTNWQVIDIGTGAGFPGLPVAIACPSWQVTLLDSMRKRTNFVTETVKQLGLTNTQVQTARAETITGTYDLALIRAVGTIPLCLDYCSRLVKVGGRAVLYRGKFDPSELPDSLTWQLVADHYLPTPLTQADRHYLHFLKHSI